MSFIKIIFQDIFTKCSSVFAGISVLFFVTACDSGDIYPEDNKNFVEVEVSASFAFKHIDAFPKENYQIIVGFFDDDPQKPILSKTIQKPKNEEDIVVIKLNKIPVTAKYMRLVLSYSKAGTTVYTFWDRPINSIPAENLTLPLQTIDLLQYKRIQKQVFSQCIQCHGGSDHAAANLYLTEDKSYINLYNVNATQSTKLRVDPNNAANSFILDILNEKSLRGPHSSVFTTLSKDDVLLIEEWIESGAENIK